VRIPRLLTIVGPAAVLYTLAARASSETTTPLDWQVAALALAFSLSPLAVAGVRGARRASAVALMGVSFAVAIASSQAGSATLERVHDYAWLAAAVAMLDLALPSSVGSRIRLIALVGLAVSGVGAGLLADRALLPAASFAVFVVSTMLATGAVHQLVLTARGHTVEGALSAIAIVSLAVGLSYAWVGALPSDLGLVVEVCVGLLLWLGHLAWVNPRWRSLRRVGVPMVAASSVCFVAAYALWPSANSQRWTLGALAICAGFLWWAVFASVGRLSRRSIWAASARLADAAETARRDLVGRTTLEDLATAVLLPLDRAFARGDATIELHSFEPPLRLRLDAGERPSIRAGKLSPVIVQALLQGNDRDILDLMELLPKVVRDPSVRELVAVMKARSAGAVVPCVHLDHLEGALVMPLGERGEPLAPVEAQELRRLGTALGGALCAVLAQRRAQSQVHELSELRRAAENRVATLQGELAALRDQCDALGRALADDQTFHVAYSPSMRRVQTRAIELSAREEPVVLVAGAGAPTLPVARFIHDRGPRWQAPFVVADCAAPRPETVEERLFGSDGGKGGAFHSAMGGTLMLRNVPALERSLQARVAGTIRERAGTIDAGASDVPVTRVIATARRPLDELRTEGALECALADVLTGHTLVIPSLKERREDVPSLALLAIDRACRVLGRDPVGIDQAAMSALVAHVWPGDVAELELVIELAVLRTAGKTITLSDLPPFATRASDHEALTGTYSEVERRLLEHALRRAGGNKSEAARSLALKRTTFLDKLRRHGLDERPPEDAGDAALG
jgi:DNA-binding NtrC family response regulator